MKRQDFRFAHRLRVRWVEVDMQQIVFNGHSLMYFDTAVTDYWRRLAMPYAATMAQLGGDMYVKRASVEYHASAGMDDFLDVCMRCDRIGNSSMSFAGAIFRGDELLHVHLDPAHAQAVGKAKVLSFHGVSSQKRVSKPCPHRHARSGRRARRGPW